MELVKHSLGVGDGAHDGESARPSSSPLGEGDHASAWWRGVDAPPRCKTARHPHTQRRRQPPLHHFVVPLPHPRFALGGGYGLWRKTDQTACKPGSVPPGEPGAAIIPLDRPSRAGSRDLPGRLGPATALPTRGRRNVPIRSCSWRGLPCRRRYRRRGALLPHPFTLALRRSLQSYAGRFAFCGAIPGVAPGGRYPPPCRRGARTFLELAPAIARPSGPRGT